MLWEMLVKREDVQYWEHSNLAIIIQMAFSRSLPAVFLEGW